MRHRPVALAFGGVISMAWTAAGEGAQERTSCDAVETLAELVYSGNLLPAIDRDRASHTCTFYVFAAPPKVSATSTPMERAASAWTELRLRSDSGSPFRSVAVFDDAQFGPVLVDALLDVIDEPQDQAGKILTEALKGADGEISTCLARALEERVPHITINEQLECGFDLERDALVLTAAEDTREISIYLPLW